MTPKERVQRALNHQVPDRVPLALWGGPYGLVDELYYQILDLLEIDQPTPPFRRGHTVTHMDDRVLDALDVDTRYVWPGASPTSPRYPTDSPDRMKDEFGQIWIKTEPYYSTGESILKDIGRVEEIDEIVNWPDVDHPQWTEGVTDRARYLSDETQHYIIARMVTSHGPYQLACDLRGTANFLMDMSTHPELSHTLLTKVTDILVGLTKNYLAAGGKYFDMIELPGDDYASNENLIFSPEMFNEFIKPCIQRMITVIRDYRPDIDIMVHSDGAIDALIPEFIDLGIDVLHPLEPVSGMDIPQVKETYGDQIAFLGGIDITHAMPGSKEDVRAEVDRCLEELAPGGGYVLSPANHLQEDVPPENVLELYRYAKEAGTY